VLGGMEGKKREKHNAFRIRCFAEEKGPGTPQKHLHSAPRRAAPSMQSPPPPLPPPLPNLSSRAKNRTKKSRMRLPSNLGGVISRSFPLPVPSFRRRTHPGRTPKALTLNICGSPTSQCASSASSQRSRTLADHQRGLQRSEGFLVFEDSFLRNPNLVHIVTWVHVS
jgi:hypothetical protein